MKKKCNNFLLSQGISAGREEEREVECTDRRRNSERASFMSTIPSWIMN
jgi:hypothetical protein